MGKILKIIKNFYTVLSVCVLTVVIVCAAFGVKYVKEYNLKKMALYSPPEYVEAETEKTVETTKNVSLQKEKKEAATETLKEQEEKEVMSVVREEKFVIIMPAGTEIIKDFSGNELVFSETFGDYRVHKGIDIKCERSKPVFAVYDGIVENVYTDTLEGIVVEINHNNGFKTIYKNLSTDKMVKKGEKVTQGQAISGVGETAVFESLCESHLHFELMKDGEFVNPKDYMEI